MKNSKLLGLVLVLISIISLTLMFPFGIFIVVLILLLSLIVFYFIVCFFEINEKYSTRWVKSKYNILERIVNWVDNLPSLIKTKKEKEDEEGFECYEIWRANMPQYGCTTQCKECKLEEKNRKNLKLNKLK